MYAHILLPTDGSAQDAEAIAQGVALARALGARVTGLHVIGVSTVASGLGEMVLEPDVEEEAARAFLDVVTRAAAAAGVSCDTAFVRAASTADGIAHAADSLGCDLIAMATHGRQGVARLLMGSVTAQVLERSRLPVLVYR